MRVTLVSFGVVSVLMAAAVPASGQERIVEARDPAVAIGLAWLCPGCGHFYSGETTKGALIAGISVGSVMGGLVVQLKQSARYTNLNCQTTVGRLDCNEPSMDLTPILVGGAIGLAGYVYGLIDAGPSARRMNERNGLAFRELTVGPAVAPDGSLGARFTIPLASVR